VCCLEAFWCCLGGFGAAVARVSPSVRMGGGSGGSRGHLGAKLEILPLFNGERFNNTKRWISYPYAKTAAIETRYSALPNSGLGQLLRT
jgi:hypothetical protein